MKPISRKALHSSNFLNSNFNTGFGSKNTIACIKGSVKKLSVKYAQAWVVAYNKADLLPYAVRRPDANGDYQFLGLNTELKTFVVAFDKDQQFNAVIQDNVVPK